MKIQTIAIIGVALFGFVSSSYVLAQSYTPERNSPERRTFLNLTRPYLERELGAPIVMIVKEIKIIDDWGFLRVEPRRRGGGEINLQQTPIAKRSGPWILEAFDCCHTEVFFRKINGGWRVIDKSIGSTDLWYVSYCDKVPHGLVEACKYEPKQ